MDMPANEKTLSKKEIDEYILLHYKADDDSSPSFLNALEGAMVFLPGKRYATTPAEGGGLQYLLDKIRSKIELTFSEKLMELINEKGKKPAEIYKKAYVDKALFSKIKADKNYHLTKATALANKCGL